MIIFSGFITTLLAKNS